MSALNTLLKLTAYKYQICMTLPAGIFTVGYAIRN